MRPSFRQSLKRLVMVAAIGLTALVPIAHDFTAPANAAPPQITITAPAEGGAFQPGESVIVEYSCSDDTTPDPTCGGDLANGAAIDTSIEGDFTFTVTAEDGDGETAALTHNYSVDGTDPTISITSPADGDAFFPGSVVDAAFTCSDDRSGIETCVGTVASGSPISTVGSASKLFSVTATDMAGNSTTTTHTYTIDATDPTATITSPPDGSSYKPGTNVDAAYTCNDIGSGIASCIGDVPAGTAIDTATEGPKTFSVTAIDNVGNDSTTTHDYIVDGTTPVVSITTPSSGATYDTGATINAAYTCDDAGSGIASCIGDATAGTPIDTATEGPKTFSVTATDNAGNTTTLERAYTVVTPDTTGPVVTITSPTDGSAYRVATPVFAAYACTDADSGVVSCVGPTLPGTAIDTATEGTKTFRVTGTDAASNTTVVDHTYTVDSTPPIVTISGPADGGAYTVGATILADYACSDGLSGVASCVGDVAVGAAIDTATAGAKAFSVTAVDAAGNSTTVTHTYIVDGDPPTIAIFEPGDGDAYVFGSDVTVNFACIDIGSGIATCSGTLPDGASLDTSTGGDFSFTVTATDGAGNVTVLTHQYSVESADSIPQKVALISPANGAVYENGAVVFVDFTCIKYTSCVGSVPEGTLLDTVTPGTFSVTVTATDDAGKVEQVTNTYTVEPPDLTAPVVTLTSPPEGAEYDFKAVVTARYACSDDSGTTTCDAPYPVGDRIDTTTPGVFSFTVRATDPSGNTTIVSHTYTVGEPDTFIDDDSSVFEQDIEWLAASGITRGCNPPLNDRFCPKSLVTRAQIAAFLSRALNLTEQLDDPYIDDDDSIFEDDIERIAAG